jgi:hypothetical protein
MLEYARLIVKKVPRAMIGPEKNSGQGFSKRRPDAHHGANCRMVDLVARDNWERCA